jgi:hypothetical protein
MYIIVKKLFILKVYSDTEKYNWNIWKYNYYKKQILGKYGVDYRATIDKINKIKKLMYKIDNVYKPVNGISTYKTHGCLIFYINLV